MLCFEPSGAKKVCGRLVLLNAQLYPVDEKLPHAFREARIYFDTVLPTTTIMAWSACGVVTFLKEPGPDRFLFGSGYPFRDPVPARMRLNLPAELNQQTRAAIWGHHALRLLQP